jgi:hypothetical protein
MTGSNAQWKLPVSDRAVWFHYGKPAVIIRCVLLRDPQDQYETTCLLNTDYLLASEQIVQWFVTRWQMEVTFEEARTTLPKRWVTYAPLNV